jgi:uncharacterized phage infection (PIP) family protein YhgE
MPTSLPDLLAAARQMVTALQANQERLAARGSSPEFIQKGSQAVATLQALDSEQERLKAQLKTVTAQLESTQKTLADWQSEANNMVKLAYRGEQEKWIEFGIKAKR